MCVVSKPKNYHSSTSSPSTTSESPISSIYKAKNDAFLLQNYRKLSKIKNQRNRRVKSNPNQILAARRALLHRAYSESRALNRKYLRNSKNQVSAQKRRLTRKITSQDKRKTSYLRPEITLTLVNGADSLYSLKR